MAIIILHTHTQKEQGRQWYEVVLPNLAFPSNWGTGMVV